MNYVVMFSAAYKHADGKKIDGRRVLVDVERGRTVKGWMPRRLGNISWFYFMYCIHRSNMFCNCLKLYLNIDTDAVY